MYRSVARGRRACLLTAFCVASAGTVDAQPLGAAPGARQLEVGGSVLQIRRTIRYDDGKTQASEWGRGAAFARYGLTDWFSLTGDGAVNHEGATDRFPGRDYWDVSAGLGATAAVMRRGRTRLTVAARGHMFAMLDESEERYSKRTSHVTAAALLERRVGGARWNADAWAGPAYVRDRLTQLPPFRAAETARSRHDWGAVAGVSLRVARFRAYGQSSYAGRWQPELGGSVLF